MSSCGMSRDVVFGVVHPAFPLPTMESPTLQGAMKDGFGEAVVACDIPEPCKFPCLVKRRETASGVRNILIWAKLPHTPFLSLPGDKINK